MGACVGFARGGALAVDERSLGGHAVLVVVRVVGAPLAEWVRGESFEGFALREAGPLAGGGPCEGVNFSSSSERFGIRFGS